MSFKHSIYSLLLSVFSFTAAAQSFTAPAWTKNVGARSFPTTKTVYYVNSYGAVSDTVTVNTKAIQKAIDAAHNNKGGKVVFSKGRFCIKLSIEIVSFSMVKRMLSAPRFKVFIARSFDFFTS